MLLIRNSINGSADRTQIYNPRRKKLHVTSFQQPDPRHIGPYMFCMPFYPNNFGCLLSQMRLSSVVFMRRTQGVETFGNISSPFCTLAILWPPCKILQRSSQGNPSVGGAKRRGVAKENDVTFGYLTNSYPDEFLVVFSRHIMRSVASVCVCPLLGL